MNSSTELVHSETGLIYRLRRGQPHHPAIILLHGLSGDENVMWIFEQALPKEATLIAPRALYASELGGYSWSRSERQADLDHVDFEEALDHLARLAPEVGAQFQIDHLIVMGFSQGAALSYAWSLARPEQLHGVIALAGFLPNSLTDRPDTAGLIKPTALPHYLIIHGTQDEAVPIERARAARSFLKSHGANVEYHEYPVDHKVSAQGMKEIAQWFNQAWQSCA